MNKQKGQSQHYSPHFLLTSSLFPVIAAVPYDQRVWGQHQLLLLLREQRDGAAALRKRQPAAESQRPDPRGEERGREEGRDERGKIQKNTVDE